VLTFRPSLRTIPFEANDRIYQGGIRRGPGDTLGFFRGIAHEPADPWLEMTEFLADDTSTLVHFRSEGLSSLNNPHDVLCWQLMIAF